MDSHSEMNSKWLIIVTSIVLGVDGSDWLTDNARIVGGSDAPIGVAPYQVSIQTIFSPNHLCGGAIISERYVVTAGHCAWKRIPEQMKIVSGTNEYDLPGQIHYVERIHWHCNYDEPLHHNDVALIRTNDTIKFDIYTQPVPMGYQSLSHGAEVTITGWGSKRLNGRAPKKLQIIKSKVVSFEECAKAHTDGWVDVGTVCTYTAKGEGTCHGDSGGPVVHNGKLVGLVSWGQPCADGFPDVHASVPFYFDYFRTLMSGCSNT